MTCFALVARADDGSTFDAGQTAYDAGQYAQAEILFRKMLDPKNPPCATAQPGEACRVRDEYLERARSFMAACLVVLKRPEEADILFEQNLLALPTWEPNPAIYPLGAWQRFQEVKRRLKPRLDAIIAEQQQSDQKSTEARQKAKEEYNAWIQRLERMASQRQLVASNSRLIALLPFGVGQFQNRDRNLGIVFLTSELAAGGLSIGTAILTNQYGVNPHLKSCPGAGGKLVACDGPATAALKSNLSAALTANRISFVSLIGLAVLGVAQAQIGFAPLSVTNAPQPRAIPPAPAVDVKVEPVVSVLPHGAFFGVNGTF